ncbi:MAG: HTTM domain-containing protein [Polyangiales bacterium]
MTRALEALHHTEQLVGLAVALQTLELFAVRRKLGDACALGWPAVRRGYVRAPRSLVRALDRLFAARAFVLLLAVQLASAIGLACAWFPHAAAPVLVLTSLALSVRFRGPYNGGSDVMTMVVLLGVSLARALGDERGRQIGLGYVAAQLVLSYFVAGAVKLRRAHWRSGEALTRLCTAGSYDVAPFAARVLGMPGVARTASWAVIALECGFPLALLDARACAVLLALGAGFHVANAYVLGLNRFLWAWLAAYPALAYWTALAD